MNPTESTPEAKAPMSAGPLSHIKVIDFSRFAAGPYCAKLLADFGADVVKVESPQTGDDARLLSTGHGDPQCLERSPLFLYVNTNKRGVTIDVNVEQGREVFRKLIADADILIEDRTPGEMDRWGLGYEDLKRINPGLVVTSTTPFGQTGPYSGYKAYHVNLFHASGQGYLLPMNSPNRERAPVKGAGFLGEFDAGTSAAIATLAAIFWRGAGGTGQHIDVSKQHSVMHLEKSQLRRYVDDGESPDRTGMGRLLETLVKGKDGNYVVIILSSQLQWSGLFEAMGQPMWGAEPPFDTQAGRSANYPELRRHLQEWADGYTAEEIFHKVQGCRSACAPVYLAEHFVSSPQVAERDFLVEIEHPVVGRLKYPGRPYQFSNESWQGTRPAPLLGEHTDDVLGKELGYSVNELAGLKNMGAI
jgi:crotonobetainyl-CoA:carnitine CoA-transferase CaiB-like acyl-CoA transferase